MQVLAAVWSFIQNQILGMKWLSSIVYSVLNVLGLDMNTRVGGMIHFFVYDLAKIFLLLSVLIFVYPMSKAISHRKGRRKLSAVPTEYG